MPGITMSPRPSMAKLVAPIGPFSNRSWGKTSLIGASKDLATVTMTSVPNTQKNVIEEEAAEQDAASDDVVEVKQLDSVDGEGHSQQIVGQPVLLQNVPNTHHRAEAQTHQVVGIELVVDDGLLGLPLALSELQMEGNDGHRRGNQLQHEGGDHVREGKDAEYEEVEREQHVDVLLAKDVEDHVETEEGAGGDERKHHGVLLCHRLWSFTGPLVIILLLLLRVNTSEAAKEDGYQGHDDKAAIGDDHPLLSRGHFGSPVNRFFNSLHHLLCGRGRFLGHLSLPVEVL